MISRMSTTQEIKESQSPAQVNDTPVVVLGHRSPLFHAVSQIETQVALIRVGYPSRLLMPCGQRWDPVIKKEILSFVSTLHSQLTLALSKSTLQDRIADRRLASRTLVLEETLLRMIKENK